MQETYEGGCHCGRVRFRIRADLGQLGECNCSICTKKGILHLPVLREDFELLSGAEALMTYRFNTGVAEHIFCKFCGIHSYGVPRVRPDRITVNARCLDNVARHADPKPVFRRPELGGGRETIPRDGTRSRAVAPLSPALWRRCHNYDRAGRISVRLSAAVPSGIAMAGISGLDARANLLG